MCGKKKLSKKEALKKLRKLLKRARAYGSQSDIIVAGWGSVPKRWPEEIREQSISARTLAICLREEALELRQLYNIGHRANWKLFKLPV